jgi:hypothetical protein
MGPIRRITSRIDRSLIARSRLGVPAPTFRSALVAASLSATFLPISAAT